MSSWLYLPYLTDLDCSRTFETANKNNATLEEPDALIEPELRIPKRGRVPDILNMEKFYSWNVGEYGPPSREELVSPALSPGQGLHEEPLGFEFHIPSAPPTSSPKCHNKRENASPSTPSVKSRDTLSPQRITPFSSADAPLSKQAPSPSSPSRGQLSINRVRPPFSEDAPLVAVATGSASTTKRQNQYKSSTNPSVCPSSTTSCESPHNNSSSCLASSETVIPHQSCDFDDFFYNSHADEYVVEVDTPELDPRYVSFISREELFGMPVTANDSLNEYDNDASEVHMSAAWNDWEDEHDDAYDSYGSGADDECGETTSAESSPRRIAGLPAREAILPAIESPLSVDSRTEYDWRSDDDEEEFTTTDNDDDGDYVDTVSRPSKRRRTNASKAFPARPPRIPACRRDKGKGRALASRSTSENYSSSSEEDAADDDDGSDYRSAPSSSSNRRRARAQQPQLSRYSAQLAFPFTRSTAVLQ